MYVCMHVCMYVCIYIYIYIYQPDPKCQLSLAHGMFKGIDVRFGIVLATNFSICNILYIYIKKT